MRVVLDTNVIISGMLWSGTPRNVLQLAKSEKITTVTSELMLDELRDVLQREKFAKYLQRLDKSPEELVGEYLEYTSIIEPIDLKGDIVRDAKDVIVLETAVGGDANYNVSGDEDLTILEQFKTIEIVNVNKFLNSIESNE